METELILCKECGTQKPKSEFRAVKNPETCKNCINLRKEQRNQRIQPKRDGNSSTVQCTLHLSPFYTAVLNVLPLNGTKSRTIEEALENLYQKSPDYIKDFIGIQKMEIENRIKKKDKEEKSISTN